jgi:hypothetical protein
MDDVKKGESTHKQKSTFSPFTGGLIEFLSTCCVSLAIAVAILLNENYLPAVLIVCVAVYAFSFVHIMHFDKKLANSVLIIISFAIPLYFQFAFPLFGSIRWLLLDAFIVLVLAFLLELFKQNTHFFLASIFTSVVGACTVAASIGWISTVQLRVNSDYLILALVCLAFSNLPKILNSDIFISTFLTFFILFLITLAFIPTLGYYPLKLILIPLAVFVLQLVLNLLFEAIKRDNKLSFVALGIASPLLMGLIINIFTTLFFTLT